MKRESGYSQRRQVGPRDIRPVSSLFYLKEKCMKIRLKDERVIELDESATGLDVAKKISVSLAKAAIAVSVNDELKDLADPLKEGDLVRIITDKDPEAMEILNHSAAHLLAHAVKELYPGSKLAFGPAIEEGFFYDILFEETLTDQDLLKIESKMHELAAKNYPIIKKVLSKEEAKEIFKNEAFKLEHLDEIEAPYTAYFQGDFVDLCRGPHVKHTGLLKNTKLLFLAGAYYKGDQKNVQLTRIYGTCFFSAEALKAHLINLEERKANDHRRLGKELELFMLSDYGPGFPFYLPNGMIIRRELENFWYQIHEDHGYQFVKTPIILSRELWETSGHWQNYKDNMYTTKIDEKDYAIKPMSCPGGMLVYQNSIHSYRDLPLRIGELGLVHRHEASGALAGLFRVRSFTQDDAHVFLRPDQLESEIISMVRLFDSIYRVFNLPYHIELSTRPLDKYIGSIETWDRSEQILEQCLKDLNIDYKINPGDGAFYGPKLDFKLRDSMNRIWQCGTIQLDMNLPDRFDLYYVDKDGSKQRPVMLHRAILGSFERFLGIITEHFKGAFPTWLSPIQVKIIPVNNEAHQDYADMVYSELKKAGIRVALDDSNEKLNYKIRQAQIKKIPYTVIIGGNEIENKNISFRLFGKADTHQEDLCSFILRVNEDIAKKRINRD